MKQTILILVGLMTLTGCGRKQLTLAYPADGATFVLGTTQVIDVYLQDPNEYDGTTIEFRSGVPTEFMQCQNATGTQARCQSLYFGNGSGGGNQNFDYSLQQACKKPACTITVVLKKDGELMDVRTIFVQQPDNTGGGGVTTPTFNFN